MPKYILQPLLLLLLRDGTSYMTAKDIEKEITELTQEGSAYWDKNHINHQKAVDEVLKLREMLNG